MLDGWKIWDQQQSSPPPPPPVVLSADPDLSHAHPMWPLHGNNNIYSLRASYLQWLKMMIDYFFLRVPEVVYQPSMLGIEQAGIAETIEFILNHFPAELQTALVQVLTENTYSFYIGIFIFIYFVCTLFPGRCGQMLRRIVIGSKIWHDIPNQSEIKPNYL